MNSMNTHWIWLPDYREYIDNDPLLVYFRKEIELPEVPKKKSIKISADTRYKLYVNGVLAEFGPAKGDPGIWFYDEVNLAPFLQPGKNTIAVEVLRYPLAYRSGNFGMFRTTTPGLFVEEITEDGTEGLIADESWLCKKAEGFHIAAEAEGFSPLMFMEEREGREEDKGWRRNGFACAEWTPARAYSVFEIPAASCPGDLHVRPIPFMNKIPRTFSGVVEKESEETQKLWNALLHDGTAVTIPAHEKQQVELHSGEEICGYLSLRMRGGAGTKVRILTSEGYVQDGFSDLGGPQNPIKGDRLDWVKGHLHGYADQYTAGGFGTEEDNEVYEPFWFRTFRFIRLEIETAEEPCTFTGFDYLETGYPLEVSTHADASDESFKGIWDISLRSLRRCMHETYMDCPYYEQLQYAMDSRSEILFTYRVSGDDRLARQCMDDFRRSQREDGMINCCYPQYGPNIIPGFSIFYILMVHDHMMYFGDQKLVKKHLPAIDRVLGFFDDHLDARGMVGKVGGHISEKYWSFIDWALPWGENVGTPTASRKGPITMESMLYVYGLQRAADLCDYVGRKDTAEEYRQRAASVSDALKNFCRDSEGNFLDGPGVYEYSQHCQVFAVLNGMVSKEEGRVLLERSLDDPNKYAQSTVSFAFYLFRALESVGLYERTDEIWNIWRKMLKDNLTTCVENDLDGRSDCHAWGALLLYELPAVILGVRPAAPGYEKIRIAPNPGYLDRASGSVVTKWGNIDIAWERREDGSLKLEYQAEDAVKDRILA